MHLPPAKTVASPIAAVIAAAASVTRAEAGAAPEPSHGSRRLIPSMTIGPTGDLDGDHTRSHAPPAGVLKISNAIVPLSVEQELSARAGKVNTEGRRDGCNHDQQSRSSDPVTIHSGLS
jgi:hypothetical protein